MFEDRNQENAQNMRLGLDEMRRAARRRARGEKTLAARREAVSSLIAHELEKDARVQAFRTNVLQGKLMRSGAVLKWFDHAAPEDFQALSDVSAHLAERYGGAKPEYVFFVLTGEYSGNYAVLCDLKLDPHFPALSRIVLTIDPALSPEDVARYYSDIRRQVLGAHPRALSEKHQRLATFAAQRPEGETWAQRMAAWNEQFPDWRYKHETNFGRDCVRAQRRLLGFRARPNGPPDELEAPPASYDAGGQLVDELGVSGGMS